MKTVVRKVIIAASITVAGCGGSRAKFPPPVYEEPQLPPWEPEAPEVDDPFADIGAMEGDWVESPPS